MVFALAIPALAGAPNTVLVVKSPLAGGEWDRFGIASPWFHHTPWGGDWAVDLYGSPGDVVRFRIRELVPTSTVGDPYGVIESNWSSCASPYEYAGTAYRIGLYDGAGYHVGWALYAHVETSSVGLLPIGAVVRHGDVLGTIEQYAYSSCYQVIDATGVHTHFEVYNDSDWACYVPHAAGTTLLPRNAVAGVGTSNSGPGQACW